MFNNRSIRFETLEKREVFAAVGLEFHALPELDTFESAHFAVWKPNYGNAAIRVAAGDVTGDGFELRRGNNSPSGVSDEQLIEALNEGLQLMAPSRHAPRADAVTAPNPISVILGG